jgi:transcription elongation factor GreA
MSDTITITQTGFEELQQELQELKNVKIPKVIERISNAREQGDLSENADYHSARDERDMLQARINSIEEILLNTKVTASVKTSTGVISLGSVVKLEIVGKDKKITYQMSGEYESNPAEGKISIESPVGKALLKKSKGDNVEVKTPAGQITYKILEIK